MSTRLRRPALAGGLGAAVLVAVVLLLAMVDPAPPLPEPAALALPGAGLRAGGEAPRAAPAATPQALAGRAASLAGTDWDGDWALDPATAEPRPSLRLRQRFDHLLSQLGERELPALRAQLQARMEADALPEAARRALLGVFDAYVAVNQHRYQVVVDPRAPHTWPAALAERQTVRRQHLGWAWAEAFYGEEERALLATLAQLRGEAAAPAEPEPARHPDAAAREAAAEAAWSHWEQRLARARQHWQALRDDGALSAPQREAAWRLYLAERFDATEQLRVRALVQGAAESG